VDSALDKLSASLNEGCLLSQPSHMLPSDSNIALSKGEKVQLTYCISVDNRDYPFIPIIR